MAHLRNDDAHAVRRLDKARRQYGVTGIDNIRWLKPVRPGDVLRAHMTIVEVRASTSKPDRGFAKSHWEVFNQDNEVGMTMAGMGMYRRRPAA